MLVYDDRNIFGSSTEIFGAPEDLTQLDRYDRTRNHRLFFSISTALQAATTLQEAFVYSAESLSIFFSKVFGNL